MDQKWPNARNGVRGLALSQTEILAFVLISCWRQKESFAIVMTRVYVWCVYTWKYNTLGLIRPWDVRMFATNKLVNTITKSETSLMKCILHFIIQTNRQAKTTENPYYPCIFLVQPHMLLSCCVIKIYKRPVQLIIAVD